MSRDIEVLTAMVEQLDDVELRELLEMVRFVAVRGCASDRSMMAMVAFGRVLKSERSRRQLILAEMEFDLDGHVGSMLDPDTPGGYPHG